MLENFKCKECKTEIQFNAHGSITACEHHPLTELKETHHRHDFQYVLAEFARTENPVTKWSLREILIRRLESADLS